MADTKISAATDAGTLTGTDRLPLARSGSTTAYSTSLTALSGYVAISPYTSVPFMDGAGAAGGSALYSRGDHVHPSDTSKLSLSGGVMTGPLTLAADGTAALHAATKQQLDAAIAAIPAPSTPSNANMLHNSGFSVNQRGYTSGTALAAAAYGFDRWKAGSGGCTLTFTVSAPETTVTITAGSLQQIIETVRGGNHTLSWTGTAQGRIGGGSYAASPVTASLTAGTSPTVEFNTGTLSKPKLEEGATASPLARRDPADEFALCQRFYQIGTVGWWGYGSASQFIGYSVMLPVAMRGVPAVTLSGMAYTNASGAAPAWIAGNSFAVQALATTTAAAALIGSFSASADL